MGRHRDKLAVGRIAKKRYEGLSAEEAKFEEAFKGRQARVQRRLKRRGAKRVEIEEPRRETR